MAIFKKGQSVFGVSTVWNKPDAYPYPTASKQEDVPSGGFYGAGKFGYSLNPKAATSGSND